MKRNHYSDEGLIKHLAGRTPTYSPAEAVERAKLFTDGGAAVVSIGQHEVVFAHRFDVVFGIPNITISELKSLVLPGLYRKLVPKYNRAAQEILLKEGHEHLGRATFEIAFPSTIKAPLNGKTQNWVIRQKSTPFVLQDGDGGPSSFATIDQYEIIGYHVAPLYPVSPVIKLTGIPQPRETAELRRIAGHRIMNSLPFARKELDLLQELGDRQQRAEICKSLKISKNTHDDYIKQIKAKNREKLGLDSVSAEQLALFLRELDIC